ncbi:MAG: UbiA family prenyltransferase [Nitrososphaeraceae archaeon]|nr:UbiA family prenyltransferase [Nitrososphaeraceae archaeon]MDW0190702.1 UbiA family prenyltransferase [Nitrososphaeraceae archaeon]MDW0217232.1 UbiA family prenyltransferase [Nitrososphaeraceae archaeon]MDW0226229.1 UbiA family prenyltransferase [Nitrososphaeraceae archaeon]MDW0230892.1 UbiA family prenyltransferase [Nitrososphaeraceae archaeon]
MKNVSIKDYLALVRLPNLFTLPSNILVGMATVSLLAFTLTSFSQFLLLVTISVLLYCVGIVLNDLYDFDIDKKERPNRPLPSGKISRRSAIVLVAIFSTLALILSLQVSFSTLVISSILFSVIFGYDKYLKNTYAGPFTIASARVMNILLGTSVSLRSVDSYSQIVTLTFILIITFVYVSLIGFISRYEVHGFSDNTKLLLPPAIVATVISSIILFTLMGFFKLESLIILSLFSFIMIISFSRIYRRDSGRTQQIVRNMILSIIVLDSTFLTGIIGIELGLVVLTLMAPLLVLANKMYMT